MQSDGGLWHQVLNESSTYLETSATAMNVLSIAVGNHYDIREFNDLVIIDSIIIMFIEMSYEQRDHRTSLLPR